MKITNDKPTTMRLIAALKVGIAVTAASMIAAPMFASAALSRQLDIGATGADVSELQTFLAQDVTMYPRGLVTGYFGPLTKDAVAKFQSRNGIDPVGRVGPITLAALNTQMAQLGTGGGTAAGRDVSAPLIFGVNVATATTTTTTTTGTSTTATSTATTTMPQAMLASATVKWTTNDMSKGKVYYDTAPIKLSNTFDDNGINFVEPTVSGRLVPYDTIERQSHSVNITGLLPNTTYYYLVEALDSSNNVSITPPASFRTM